MSFSDPAVPGERAVEQYRALLDISESIAEHRELPHLFEDLAQRLRHAARFDFVALMLHDPAAHRMRLHLLQALDPRPVETGLELDVQESPAGWVWEHQEPLVFARVEQESRFPRVTALLLEQGVVSCCWLPLTSAQRRLGAIGFGSLQPHEYAQAEMDFLGQVARQIAVAVDNALNYQAAEAYQCQLARERDRLRVLLELNNALVSSLDFREVFAESCARVREVIPHDHTDLVLYDEENKQLRIWSIESPEAPRGVKGRVEEEITVPAEGTPAGEAIARRKPLLVDREALKHYHSQIAERALAAGMQTICCLPMLTHNRVVGSLNVASRRPAAFSPQDVEMLSQVAGQVAIAVENAVAFRHIAELKNKLAEEKLYLEDEIRTEFHFEEIVGDSQALKRVLAQAGTVAGTDSTVLVTGETGTGKEVIARAIHNLSLRRERTFVKVNCAAIPTGLLESELFGHEKGAFTGAIAQRIGRFELAHGGTLFLDEVGDIPLELQPKLLRVLQEQQFERLGGARTIRVDVRLIAATNRDLSQMVANREFRSDLYYRLHVFPIVVPPLHERPEDIPLLARHFTQKYARAMDRPIDTIPSEAMEAMVRYPWPGNVRELENFIERAVILSKGNVLRVPFAELRSPAEGLMPRPVTLQDADREHIVQALRETKWVIGGPRGAAARLGVKRTTLQSKMKKLGITRGAEKRD